MTPDDCGGMKGVENTGLSAESLMKHDMPDVASARMHRLPPYLSAG